MAVVTLTAGWAPTSSYSYKTKRNMQEPFLQNVQTIARVNIPKRERPICTVSIFLYKHPHYNLAEENFSYLDFERKAI